MEANVPFETTADFSAVRVFGVAAARPPSNDGIAWR
jgi:hypothetical protein